MSPLIRWDKPGLDSTAVHEAGHAVVADAVGFRVKFIELASELQSMGRHDERGIVEYEICPGRHSRRIEGFRHDPFLYRHEVECYNHRQHLNDIVVTHAGELAQQHFGLMPILRDGESTVDREEIEDMLERYPDEIGDAFFASTLRRAQHLVKKHAHRIRVVARQLIRRGGTMNGRQFRAIIRKLELRGM